jgi:hypothetical protein
MELLQTILYIFSVAAGILGVICFFIFRYTMQAMVNRLTRFFIHDNPDNKRRLKRYQQNPPKPLRLQELHEQAELPSKRQSKRPSKRPSKYPNDPLGMPPDTTSAGPIINPHKK